MMLATLAEAPRLRAPSSLAEHIAATDRHNAALAIKEMADRLCRALHPATPDYGPNPKAMARKLSRDLQALRGTL